MSGKPSGRIISRARVEAYLRARPEQWVNALELMAVGGALAWRTRVSDLRRPEYGGLVIRNDVRHRQLYDGSWVKDSFYMYVPAETQTESAA